MEKDYEFLEYVVKNIVQNPDKIKIERTIDERGVLLALTVDPSDMGIIIGRNGQTASSLRTLLRIVGAKNEARVNLKVIEPEGGRPPKRQERDRDDKKEEDKDEDIVDDLKI